MRGFVHAFLSHQNLRLHLIIAAVVVVIGFLLKISTAEWGMLLVAIFLVLITEMINTAFEEVINLVKENYSERVKIAKDVSAGMVLLAAAFAVVTGLLVFIPYIFPKN